MIISWIKFEVIHPFQKLWCFARRHFITTLIISFIFQSFILFTFPIVWIPHQLKTINITDYSSAYVGKGRMSVIHVNSKQQNWRFNCAYMQENIKNRCFNSWHKESLNIKSMNISYFEPRYSLFKYKNIYGFINTVVFTSHRNNTVEIQASETQRQKWLKYIILPAHITKIIMILNLLSLFVLLIQRYNIRNTK